MTKVDNNLVDALVDLYYTNEYLEKKNEEYLKHLDDNTQQDNTQDIKREKWRNKIHKYRENHREQYNAYMLPINKSYYQQNKERLNKQRNINYHKKKERDRLAESLGENQKFDS